MRPTVWLLSVMAVLLGCSLATAQNERPLGTTELVTPGESDRPTSQLDIEQKKIDAWRRSQLIQGPAIAAAFVVAMLFIFVPPWRRGERMNELHFKAYTLTLIVFAGIYLVVIGWSDAQLAGIMGLLGTLAGYILGERMTAPNCAHEEGPSANASRRTTKNKT